MNKRLLLLILICGGLALAWFFTRPAASRGNRGQSLLATSRGGATAEEIAAEQQKLDRTVWAKELAAEHCGKVVERWWDTLNRATNKLREAATFDIPDIQLPDWGETKTLAHGIRLQEPDGPGRRYSVAEWRSLLNGFESNGWQLAQCEFRHVRFDSDPAGDSRHSVFEFSAHLANTTAGQRAIIEGNLAVDWATPASDEISGPRVAKIDASRLTLKMRGGKPAFRSLLDEPITPPRGSFFIDPLILYDLDHDGLSEIILAAKNLVFHRNSQGTYETTPLCRYPPGLIFTGLIADFDGDGSADFLCAKFEGLMLFRGSPRGTFDEPGKLVWRAPRHLKYATAFTCGDVNHDGALDVFLGQYRLPYEKGAMPTPWYDANDGYPSYLLLNDGKGNFRDATTGAGLGQKRSRRSYGASLADLDGDGNLDLVVVSDFAGVDVYGNDSTGHFSDLTSKWLPEAHGFGMGEAFTDFNSDGRLDFVMIGMPSATADRLEHAGLWNNENPEERSMRARMTYGNRLYIARQSGGFDQQGNGIARAGWAWGCAAADFDNDGFPDLYIANGHETKETVADYDPEFWLHDIYVGDAGDNPAVEAYFNEKFARTRGRGQSYGGYDKNRFYFNLDGKSFFEAGYLMGVALEQDSRNTVAEDLDGDGRMDLLVTTFEVWPKIQQTLRVFRNELEDPGNWIGFRFREDAQAGSPVGVKVLIHAGGKKAIRQIVAGDSYRCQQANTVHFGLGKGQRVDSVEIIWPSGKTLRLEDPAINRYHTISR